MILVERWVNIWYNQVKNNKQGTCRKIGLFRKIEILRNSEEARMAKQYNYDNDIYSLRHCGVIRHLGLHKGKNLRL